MDQLIENLKHFLHETLKADVEAHLWREQKSLPYFLFNNYCLYETSLLGQPSLLMIPREDANTTPGTIGKHLELIQKNWNGQIIYVPSALPSYSRKRLIEQHIPFIVPGNQMYLPQSGIYLLEHFKKMRKKKSNSFSPGTQAAVIYALLRESDEKLTPTHLAKRLGYTVMTMTRALQELEDAGIGEFHREGREKYWVFAEKEAVWAQALSFLRSPVRKQIWLKHHPFKTTAGLSALSHFSQLAPPSLPVFAIGFKQWAKLLHSNIEELPLSEEASLELEIWNYDPELFAKAGFVDPFSLYLSLKTYDDERIESALEEMIARYEMTFNTSNPKESSMFQDMDAKQSGFLSNI